MHHHDDAPHMTYQVLLKNHPTSDSETLKKLFDVLHSMDKGASMPVRWGWHVYCTVGKGNIYSCCNATGPLIALGSKEWQPVCGGGWDDDFIRVAVTRNNSLPIEAKVLHNRHFIWQYAITAQIELLVEFC